MKPILFKSKQELVTLWVQKLRKSTSKVLISNCCYNCFLTGNPKNKTLIVFPGEIERKGIISIDKPLEQLKLKDIIQLYARINKK